MGFSYNVSFQGEEATSSFIISLKTSSDKYVYRVFDSKKEYLEAIKRLKEQKNKEDENKK